VQDTLTATKQRVTQQDMSDSVICAEQITCNKQRYNQFSEILQRDIHTTIVIL